jgi:sortase B
LRNQKPLLIALLVAVLAVMLAAGIWLGRYVMMGRQTRAQYSDAASAAVTTPGPTPTLPSSPDANAETPLPTMEEAWYAPYASKPDKVVDFAALSARNPSIYAWITVPGTKIDYPVVMAERGEDFYLIHDAFGDKSYAGAIFAETYNRADFSDRLTFLYGHNMRDGSMFHGLRAFQDAKFFDAHDEIYIYVGDIRLKYRIVACYTATDEHLLSERDFANDEVWADYLDSIRAQRSLSANLRGAEDLTTEDRILTLSTCVSDQEDKRLFVQAVLVKNE